MTKEIEILLVEDNPDHAELTKRALEDGNLGNQVRWLKDGQEATDYLLRKGNYANANRPGLILLDIKLPKLDGIEVLKKIKGDDELRIIPVVMLTTSDRDEELYKCYKAGANSFITKPVKFNEFSEKIKSLKFYWLLTNQAPKANY